MRQGDVVAYCPKVGTKRGKTVVAKVLRWSGDPDTRVLLIDGKGNTYRPYADSTHHLQGDVARAFRLEIDQFLETKDGRKAVATAIARPVRSGGMGKPQGTGSPEFCQEPLQLVKGMSSEPNDWLLQYVRGTWTENKRMLKALRAYKPAYYDVLFWNVERRESLAATAERLGMTHGGARMVKTRAMRWLRDWIERMEKEGAA